MIDVQRIYHKKEPRTLAAALQFYCGEKHTDAHGSEEDARATMKVLEAQLEKYDDLPTTVAALEQYANPKDPTFVVGSGKLRWRNGEVSIGFGQKSGTSLRTLADKDPGYLKWIIRGNFEREVKDIVSDALEGTFLEKKEKSD